MKIITYDEFQKLVPKETTEMVDSFLKFFVDSATVFKYETKNKTSYYRHGLMFLDYMGLNDEYTKVLLSNYGYNKSIFISFESREYAEKNKLFGMFSDIFCDVDNIYEYQTLTIYEILFKITKGYTLSTLNIYDLFDGFTQSYLRTSMIDKINQNDFLDKLSNHFKDKMIEEKMKIKSKLSSNLYNGMKTDIVNFIDLVSVYYNELLNNYDNNFESAKVKAVLAAIYTFNYTAKLKDELLSKGILFEDIFKNEIGINKINFPNIDGIHSFKLTLSNLEESKDVCITKYYYGRFLKTTCENISSLIIRLLDRKELSSTSFEDILMNNNMKFTDFEMIVKNSLKSENDYLDLKKKIYEKYSLKVINYINYISSITSNIDKVKDIFGFNDEEVVATTILLNIIKDDYKGPKNFFNNLGIKLEDLLKYFGIELKEEESNNCLEMVYETINNNSIDEMISSKGLSPAVLSKHSATKDEYSFAKEKYNTDPDCIELNFLIIHDDFYKKILSKIYPDLKFKNSISRDLVEYTEKIKKMEKEQIKNSNLIKAKEFFKDLPNETVEYINTCYACYNLIKKKYNSLFNDIEVTALSLYAAINRFKEMNCFAEFIYNKLNGSNNNYLKIFNSDFLTITNDFKYDSYVDNIDEIESLYSKFIFDGVNIGKESKNIEIIDVFKNMLNKGLYDTTALLEFLRPYEFFDTTKLDEIIKEECEKELEFKVTDTNIKIFGYRYYDYYMNYASLEIKSKIDNIGIKNFIRIVCSINNNCRDCMAWVKHKFFLSDFLKILNINDKDIKYDKKIDYLLLYKLLSIPHIWDYYKALEDDNVLNLFSNFNNEEINEIKYELENHKPYEKPLTKEEKLDVFNNQKLDTINFNDNMSLMNFGSNLGNFADEIVTNIKVVNNSFDEMVNNEGYKLVSMVNDSKAKSKKSFLDIFKKRESSLQIRKELLDEIDVFLISKEESLLARREELEYLKLALRIYLSKAKEYMDYANKELNSYKALISSKNYSEFDLTKYDDESNLNILENKVSMISSSIIMNLEQYQKIVMQLNTHNTLIHQIDLFRKTKLQSLYIELSLHEGVLIEKESIDAMNQVTALLQNLSVSTTSAIVNNIEAINNYSKENEKIGIDENSLNLLENIANNGDVKKKIK